MLKFFNKTRCIPKDALLENTIARIIKKYAALMLRILVNFLQ